MTEIKAKVVQFDLEPHTNADTLSIANVHESGWCCIVRTEDFKNTNLGIYIPIDSLVDTTKDEFKFFDKDNSGKPFKIKTIRLRGVISQGLLIPAPEGSKLGDDYTETLNVKRYEPKVPVQMAGGSIAQPSTFTKYTSIDNVKNYPNALQEGESVRVTLKLHGSNFRAGYISDPPKTTFAKIIHQVKKLFNKNQLTYIVGSHNVAKEKNGTNVYSQMSKKLDIENKLVDVVKSIKPKFNFIVFGEIVGSGIQDLTYGCAVGEQKLYLFDVMIDGKYQEFVYVQKIANLLGVETVPLLYRGPYSKTMTMALKSGKDPVGNHLKEGVVVTTEPERQHRSVGRVVIKFISDEYLLRKNPTDGH